MIVRVIPLADGDINTLADELEENRRGQGAKFLTAYRAAAESIEQFPQMYPEVEDGVPGLEIRNAILVKFELRVIYAIWKGEAVIVAVIHARRRSDSWQSRLTELD